MKEIANFLKEHFRHFNAGALVDAAEGYIELLDNGGKMFLAMAGAMSTAELGISLAEMIREKKVHAICCTGANLEEDVFNLVGHNKYHRVPDYRDLTPKDEQKILSKKLYRVTDTILPESAMKIVEDRVSDEWQASAKTKKRFFPHEPLFKILLDGSLEKHYKIDPKDSWMLAAAENDLPMFVPGWEDSTLGNVFAAEVIDGDIDDPTLVKHGIEYMVELANWYETNVGKEPHIGFFQIGGGIAGDFPICVVPMLHADLHREGVPLWAYFCQISDSTTSYGSYSGAVPNEKITWDKLGEDTPRFIIESDATIVAPLIFAYVLNGSTAKQRNHSRLRNVMVGGQ